jgi:hypothetical protein
MHTEYAIPVCYKNNKKKQIYALPYKLLTFRNTILNHSLFTSPCLENWHAANLHALMIKLTLKGC